jgi:hypothetical protein
LSRSARAGHIDEAPKPSNDVELLVDAHEAGRLLGMSPAAVRAAAYRKSIPCVRHGRLLRFRPSDLARR